MPYMGRQRSKLQKVATTAMYKRRWLQTPSTEANKTGLVNRHLPSQAQQKHRREMEEAKKLEYNSQRREKRMGKKLVELQARIQEAEVLKERYKGRAEKWKKEKEFLKKEIARLKARDRRGSSRIQHAVQKAIKRGSESSTSQPVVRYVKDKRGIVRDWARNTILTLVNKGIPMSKTWGVAKASVKGLGVRIVGTWSCCHISQVFI